MALLKRVPSRRRRSARKSTPQEPSNIPPLPYEIHYRILQYLSFNELFYTRSVNRWYYDACLKIIHDKYVKPSRVLLMEWSCETNFGGPHLDFYRLDPASRRGSSILKWEGKELPFNKFSCGWAADIVLIGGECRRAFFKFSYCLHYTRRKPEKWLMKRMQIQDKSGLRDIFLFAPPKDTRWKNNLIKVIIGDGVDVTGLEGLSTESTWEMIVPMAMLLSMIQDFAIYYQ